MLQHNLHLLKKRMNRTTTNTTIFKMYNLLPDYLILNTLHFFIKNKCLIKKLCFSKT